jgi:hypothetical protein
MKAISIVVLATDYLSLVHRISASNRDHSTVGAVVRDIKMIQAEFQSCLVKFFNHKTNVVAHKLAQNAESLVCKFLVDVCPEFIYLEITL